MAKMDITSITYDKSADRMRALLRTGILRHDDILHRPERFFLAHRLLAYHSPQLGPGFWIRFTVHYNLCIGRSVIKANPLCNPNTHISGSTTCLSPLPFPPLPPAIHDNLLHLHHLHPLINCLSTCQHCGTGQRRASADRQRLAGAGKTRLLQPHGEVRWSEQVMRLLQSSRR